MQGSRRVSAPLTNVSVQYKNDEYIASDVLPDMMVKNESDIYYVYNNDFRLEETVRANGTVSKEATYDVSTSTYRLDEHALKDKITKRDRNNVSAPLQLDRDTTEYLTDKIDLRQEKLAADLLFTTTSFSNNATLNTATSWAYNTTTSAPIQNVLSATSVILKASGTRPNIMVINQDGLEALKENANIYNRIQYVERAILTEDLLASLFDVKKLKVGTAVYESAKEGDTSSRSYIWGSDALLANVDPSPRLKTRTAAAMLRMSMGGKGKQVSKWYQDDIKGDYIEVSTFMQPKLIATASAYLFKTVALQ